MESNILERFTENFRKTLTAAKALAVELQQAQIGAEHLLYGLLLQHGSIGGETLLKAKAVPTEIKELIAHSPNALLKPNQEPQFDTEANAAIKKAILTAYANRHQYVGTEHLLAGLLQTRSTKLNTIFTQSKIDLTTLAQQVFALLKSTSKFLDLTHWFSEDGGLNANQSTAKIAKTLEQYGVNLTDQQTQQTIDPLIGREAEVNRLIQILCRRHKNNPLLLGDPGVGKTAIVEGLAKKIIKQEVPDALLNKKIYSLDLGLTVAGTMYRGEFENRLKQLIQEAKNDPNIIIFIDEIHTLVGAGAASGSLDAANLFKPALARGEIRVIGATTLNEYRKYIENDAALERRFQTLLVNEPSAQKTKQILAGVKKFYERYHQVKIANSAIEAAVKLSERYLPEKFLPDKAIDLLDEAAAAVKLRQPRSPELQKLHRLAQEQKSTQQKLEQAILAEDLSQAQKLQSELLALNTNQEELTKKREQQQRAILGEITEQDIAKLVSQITGVPLTNLNPEQKIDSSNLEKRLDQRVIGQTAAIKRVTEFLRRSQAGLASQRRPLASFLFLGPSGVGKTELAKVLAEEFFASKNQALSDREAFIRLDMSEYRESFNLSKLIGAPAGYVGYQESGQLTEAVKRRPFSLILFDEIEKAHPDIFNLLLQILDEGHLTDAAGKKINFKNTVVILTSNINTGLNLTPLGFNAGENPPLASQLAEKNYTDLQEFFRPELLNRLDDIITFQPLTLAALIKIAQLQQKELAARAKEQGLKLKFGREVAKLIGQAAQSSPQGARAIRRVLQDEVAEPLTNGLLKGIYRPRQSLQITVKNGKIEIRK